VIFVLGMITVYGRKLDRGTVQKPRPAGVAERGTSVVPKGDLETPGV
jgi:hypothetical protein